MTSDLSFLIDFFKGAMLQTILGLIFLDLIFGVALAIKLGKFDWKKLGTFYRTSVLPFILVYVGVYVAFALVPGLEEVLPVQLGIGALFSAFALNMVGSIIGNANGLGLKTK